MTLGFLFVDTGFESKTGRLFAQALIHSVRAAMPGMPVVQFTDEHTTPCVGVDDVRRLPREPMALMRFRHQASVSGAWLFLDTDVLVQRDVRKVFDKPFDIAVTTRNWPHLRPAEGFTQRMPFNAGVVFSRSQAFWAEAYDRLKRDVEQDKAFMGHQQVICDMVDSGRWVVAKLKGSRYNFPPYVDRMGNHKDHPSESMEANANIVHYKGLRRKSLLLERIRRDRLA